ncbi:uracil-DNA glycosylase [Sulfobacillus harzensis]|uniref:Type-4 uracil-DNA glycosylase n=1 Tax=Sulfobacillus harzensis TaxID=2729629 RepID=A0A7Y0Q3F8_9FIRM|nr:uracil-DNA glycosylase [Sulfobacillus harzensis]NMP24198.1 uracil-DNA glycosylase [Sulfobacillus harzensis]
MGEADCTRCALHASRTHVVVGRGAPDAKVMFLGEAPGRQEDKLGLGFQGAAGRMFDAILGYSGLSREKIWLANAVRCRPSIEGRRNRAPTAEEISACRHWLERDLSQVRPEVVVTLGRIAYESVTGLSWDAQRRAQPVPLADGSGVAFPLYHPAYLIYRRDLMTVYRQDVEALRALLAAHQIPVGDIAGPWAME